MGWLSNIIKSLKSEKDPFEMEVLVEYEPYDPHKEVYEKSLISKWWSKEHDQIILHCIDQHQWYWTMTDFYDEILDSLSEETRTWWEKKEKHWDMNKEENPSGKAINMVYQYAQARAKDKGFTKRIKKAPFRKCLLCKQKFQVDSLKPSLYVRMGSIDRIRFCDDCLTDHIFSMGNNKATKKEIRQYIKDLTQELQRIPNQNFGEGKEDFLHMSDEERIRVFRLLKNRPTIQRVKKLYGSWFAAVVDSGVLEGNVRKTKRGIMCLAKDGHTCLSLGEKTIDDLLYSLSIPHKKEVRYPEGNYRADFEVNGVFIEYFGLSGNPEYDKKTQIKKELCDKHGIKLISIYPKDVTSIQTLKEKLMKELKLSV